MEFIKGAYNENDHNHIVWSDERLSFKLSELAEINQPWQCNARREQIQHHMSIIAFECSERLRESKNMQIEEAWSLHV
jgi:hypothetical protein